MKLWKLFYKTLFYETGNKISTKVRYSLIFILMAVLITSCGKLGSFIKKNPDNFVEEAVEDFLEEKLNIEVEFTPQSDQIQL